MTRIIELLGKLVHCMYVANIMMINMIYVILILAHIADRADCYCSRIFCTQMFTLQMYYEQTSHCTKIN